MIQKNQFLEIIQEGFQFLSVVKLLISLSHPHAYHCLFGCINITEAIGSICVPTNNMIIMLEERFAGADTLSLVAQILHGFKAYLQLMLLQNNGAIAEDFSVHPRLLCSFLAMSWKIDQYL